MGRKRKNPIVQKEIKVFNVWTNDQNNYKQLNGNYWNVNKQKWEKITLIIFKQTQKELFEKVKSIPLQKLIIVKARLFKQDIEIGMKEPRYILDTFELKQTKYQQYLEYKKAQALKDQESVLETQEEVSAIESPMEDVFADLKEKITNE